MPKPSTRLHALAHQRPPQLTSRNVWFDCALDVIVAPSLPLVVQIALDDPGMQQDYWDVLILEINSKILEQTVHGSFGAAVRVHATSAVISNTADLRRDYSYPRVGCLEDVWQERLRE